MPVEFKKMGIAFQYPDNWTLNEEDALEGSRSVTVYSPGGAFWSVAIHPRATDPTQLAKAAAEAMKQEYEGLETEETQETIAGWDLGGYDLNFFYLDLTNTATIRCLRTDQATYSFFCQGDDLEFEQVRRVFLAMTTSLLSGVKRLSYFS